MIFALRQAESLRKQGIEVHQFHLRSRTSPWALVREWLRFRQENRTFGAHVVHAHFGTVAGLFSALAAGRTPLVITYRGSDLNPVPGNGWLSRAGLGRLFSQLAALRARRMVCVSRQLKERLWWRGERATVLPSGVDPDVFYPEPRRIARSRLNWSPDVPVILFNAGHNPGVKRLDLACAAVRVAQTRLPDLRMEILDGTLPSDLMPTYMNAADCLLLTSDSEGSPTVVQEALACNLPVVSVNVGDAADRLQGVSGTRVAARHPEALGQAMVDLLRQGSRGGGRERIQEFSLPHIARNLITIYESLATVPRGRREEGPAA